MRISHANRGDAFETLIDHTNRMYENMRIAVINKRPTPVKILKVIRGLVSGYLEKPSTVDYDGHYRQRGVAFEAKSVRDKDRFSLNDLQTHQFEYLEKVHWIGGGISFLIVEFTAHRKTYLLPYTALEYFWDRRKHGKRGEQSIHISEMERNGFVVGSGRVPLDYLAVVDQVLGTGVVE